MNHDQLDLLSWKRPRGPAEIVPFPLHRSHGATAGIARQIVDMRRPDRTGKLNRLRNSTRKELEPLVGKETAAILSDRYVKTIRAHFAYLEKPDGTASDGPSAA
jgi:cytochrome c553